MSTFPLKQLFLQSFISTCSENFRKIYKKTLMLESFQFKITILNSQPIFFLKEELYRLCFLGKFSKLDGSGQKFLTFIQFEIPFSQYMQISMAVKFLEDLTQSIFSDSIKQNQKLGSLLINTLVEGRYNFFYLELFVQLNRFQTKKFNGKKNFSISLIY